VKKRIRPGEKLLLSHQEESMAKRGERKEKRCDWGGGKKKGGRYSVQERLDLEEQSSSRDRKARGRGVDTGKGENRPRKTLRNVFLPSRDKQTRHFNSKKMRPFGKGCGERYNGE